ncbi:unnamed protein product [Clavelina lepadiformis]|uniref:Uncharacterized protein n=1 Tax=Clavelina lepadiformis TaxID=159417 RepID=A0ABP0GQE4_CLALP
MKQQRSSTIVHDNSLTNNLIKISEFQRHDIVYTPFVNKKSQINQPLGQVEEAEKNLLYKVIQILTPTGRKYFRFIQQIGILEFGWLKRHPFQKLLRNRLTLQRGFRRHQTSCLQQAPKDKLLLYNVKDGWEPLCAFLGKQVPDKPFPHENVGAVIIAKLMATHPANQRMKKELKIAFSALLGVGIGAGYLLFKNGLFSRLLFVTRTAVFR